MLLTTWSDRCMLIVSDGEPTVVFQKIQTYICAYKATDIIRDV